MTIANKEYLPRLIDLYMHDVLHMRGAVLIEGIKWSGKTTSAKRHAKSLIDLSVNSEKERAEFLVRENPDRLFSEATPILIDEWQKVPLLWDTIRNQVDKRAGFKQFILTGSTSQTKVAETLRAHSGTGRIGRIHMHTMSLWESGDSTGEVSIDTLWKGVEKVYGESKHTVSDIAFLCSRGGWPETLRMRKDLSLKQAYLYIDEICESDIRNVDGHRRSAQKMRKVLQSYSRFSASDAPNTAIENDVFDISKNTLADYLKVLEDLFITDETEAWNPNFRSATAIRQSNTRYLADPSITTAALKMGPEDLLNDLQTFGLIFETLCVRDLKVYAQVLDADILHYRDAAGLECDAVFHGRNGKYGLIEIKLGQNRVEEGATNMLRLKKKIAASNQKVPDFLMVLTGTGFAHRREDGVYVVPIGCLKP